MKQIVGGTFVKGSDNDQPNVPPPLLLGKMMKVRTWKGISGRGFHHFSNEQRVLHCHKTTTSVNSISKPELRRKEGLPAAPCLALSRGLKRNISSRPPLPVHIKDGCIHAV